MPLLLPLALLVLAAGCVGTHKPLYPDSTATKRLNVPFVTQKRYYCGPASLSAVFSYYGVERDQEEIGRGMYRRIIRGVLKEDLVRYAKKDGWEIVKAGPSDLDEVKKHIDAGEPVIAFSLLGPRFLFRGHFVVIVGYDDVKEQVLCHTGYHSYERVWYRRFLGKWRSNWILVIRPKKKEPTSPAPPR
jgi:hypothetical protein